MQWSVCVVFLFTLKQNVWYISADKKCAWSWVGDFDLFWLCCMMVTTIEWYHDVGGGGGWLKWCNFCVNHVNYSCKPNSRTFNINIAELLLLQSCLKGILVAIFLFFQTSRIYLCSSKIYQKRFFFSIINCYYNF